MTSRMRTRSVLGTLGTSSRIRKYILASLAVIAAYCNEARCVDLIYDIANDWSDVNNPNAAWQLNKAPNTPFTVNQSDWFADGSNQKAWADEPFPQLAHVPVWMKLISTSQFPSDFVDSGTVIMHGAESARTGTEYSSLVWTSPTDGFVAISGGAWKLANDRPMVWEIRKNDLSISSGQLNPGDIYSKTNPFEFSAGSGGASAMNFAVQAGNKIELLIYRASQGNFSTFVAMNYQITLSEVPEPSTLVLGSLCVISILIGKKSRTKAKMA